jgi:transposase, IS30 family
MSRGYPVPRSVKRELFDRVCRGVAVTRASVDLGVSRSTGWVWWRDAGGMELLKGTGDHGVANPGNMSLPGGPGHRLNLDERFVIMRGRDAGLSNAEIAEQLGRDRTTIWREIRRNCNADGDYHALMAHAWVGENSRLSKDFKLKDHPLCKTIEDWMGDGWSPKLIADVLALDYPDNKELRVSHETIYQCLYVQTRGSLRADLYKCLSTKRSARKPRSANHQWRGVFQW